MSAQIRTEEGVVLAALSRWADGQDVAKCVLCRTDLQRTSTGDLVDGVRAHYKTVHPERKLQ